MNGFGKVFLLKTRKYDSLVNSIDNDKYNVGIVTNSNVGIVI